MTRVIPVAFALILAACSVAPAVESEQVAASPTVSPSAPTESVSAATPTEPTPTSPQPSQGPPIANGPIYFADGHVNRVDDGVVSVLADLVAVDVEWSPDGSQFLHVGGASTGPIYRSNADGTGTVELTQGYHPDWSPDGASIVFQRETPGTAVSESDIFVVVADGSGERRLTESPEYREVWPSWSPDGARILFSRWATDGAENFLSYEPEVVTIDLTTGEVEVIGEGDEAVYSPDGSSIAIGQCPGLVVIDAASYIERFDATASCYSPAWSPNGTQLAYANNDRINVLELSSGGIRELPPFPEAVYVMRVVWSPDGSQVASIITIPCDTCYEGSQRGVLVVQPATVGDPPRWLADTALGDLEWQPARP